MSPHALIHLIQSAQRIASDSLEDAAANDEVHLFPEKTLLKIKEAGFLKAVVEARFGGQNLGLISGTNEALLKILKHIGSGNLVMGRVLEGHFNAQLLIHQFGSELQKERFSIEAIEGKLFGVWNTQAEEGTELTFTEHGNYLLNGSKTFATGTGYVTRPMITAALPDGSWQMCVLSLDKVEKKIDSSWWNPMGMKSTRSYKISFENVTIEKEHLLGNPGDYYSQPQFSGGAVRFAAVQLGGAEMLLKETIKYLKILNRTDDPFQKMRIGQMTIAVTSGNQWLEGAAKRMDDYMNNSSPENAEIFLAYTNMMRTAIEQICTEVMALCQKCVGARGLNKPYHFERIIRDLNTYLRQPAPDAALADIGKFILHAKNTSDPVWEI